MSPIIARAAFRSATRAAGRTRQFSVLNSLRSFGRSLESHPFERLPATSRSQAGDWGKQVKRVAGQGAVFVPTICLMLGWPYLAKVAVGEI